MHRFANPARFLRIARWATPLTLVLGLILTTAGLYIGLFASPPDYQQGESVRIMYVHVPAAWLGSGGYLGACHRIGHRADLAPPARHHRGARHCARGRGVYRDLPDVRFTVGQADLGHLLGMGCAADLDAGAAVPLSRLSGAVGLRRREQGGERKGAAILALVGAINLPIIKYSVEWWNTLHQGSSINVLAGKSSMAPEILTPLLVSVGRFQLSVRRDRADADARHARRTARRGAVAPAGGGMGGMIEGVVARPDLWASYIWPAYILTIGGMVALLVWAWTAMRAAEKRAEEMKRK